MTTTLFQRDCFDVLKQLPKDTYHLVTDPPYIFSTSGGGIFRSNRRCMDDIADNGLDKGFDYEAFPWTMFQSAAVFCHNDQIIDLLPVMMRHFERYVICAWHKTNPMPVANKHFVPDTELWIHAWNKDAHPAGTLKDKARYWVGNNGKSKTGHPTSKPVALMEKIVRNMQPGIIVDPFMGSGTTAIACESLGVDFIGIEINETYFKIAEARIAEAKRQGSFL